MNGRLTLRRAIANGTNTTPHPTPNDGFPLVAHRPLGRLSDFVAEELGERNRAASECLSEGLELYAALESLVDLMISSSLLDQLCRGDRKADRRQACLDLAFAWRSVQVALANTPSFVEIRDSSTLNRLFTKLARIDYRHPQLSWSDIARHHPVEDPRSFLSHSKVRDQEILMYRIQGGIELVFQEIISIDFVERPMEGLGRALDGLSLISESMAFLTRVREVGQFYKLDPFLGPNNEVRGHATGSFSAWAFLAGYLFSGSGVFRDRLCDPNNRLAFDSDSHPLIQQLDKGQFPSLAQRLDMAKVRAADRRRITQLTDVASEMFKEFLKIHKGAMRKHSPGSFDDTAPATPGITNREAVEKTIEAMKEDNGWVGRDLPTT